MKIIHDLQSRGKRFSSLLMIKTTAFLSPYFASWSTACNVIMRQCALFDCRVAVIMGNVVSNSRNDLVLPLYWEEQFLKPQAM